MKLAISRRAAPKMTVSEVSALSKERGLDGVELSDVDLADAALVESLKGRVVGVRVESAEALASAQTARMAASLGAPLVASAAVVTLKSLGDVARRLHAEGAELLVSFGTSMEEVAAVLEAVAAADAPNLGVAWEVRPGVDDLTLAPGVLLATDGMLKLIRLYGGGPEVAEASSAGSGSLVTSIAMAGFPGTIVQTPSSDERLPGWEKWLTGKARYGCGTAHEKSQAAKRAQLDIRTVEPKDRLTSIMGAYHALTPGKTLHVTFDHDPSCMYYTLQATEPEGSFTFKKGDDGPTVWTAEVTRLA